MIKFLKSLFPEERFDDRITSYELHHLRELHSYDCKMAKAFTIKLLIDYKKHRGTMISLSNGLFI